jgi:predicted dienelactone hydrolase
LRDPHRDRLRTLIVSFCLLTIAGCARESSPRSPYASPGPYHFRVVEEDWFDAARSRTVPVRMYVPIGIARPPIVIFSHGTANGRDGYSYLGSHWASHGFLSVHPEHVGAGHDLEQKGPLASLIADNDPHTLEMYPEDLRFVIDHLKAAQVVVAGHSMGAYAVLALAGLKVGDRSYRDRRVVAGIPISMPGELDTDAYRAIVIPLLHITGTNDMSLVYGTLPRHRRLAFESIAGRSDEYLVTIEGGTHSTPSEDETPENARAHDVIRASTTAFLEAYLRHDARAHLWLSRGGFAHFLRGSATLEIK